jgi:hypothetical protein
MHVKGPNELSFENEVRSLLSTEAGRIFFWRLIVEDCHVFQIEYPHNAAAYSLLAKQEIGKRQLEFAKRLCPELVIQAEKEFQALVEQEAIFQEAQKKKKGDDL